MIETVFEGIEHPGPADRPHFVVYEKAAVLWQLHVLREDAETLATYMSGFERGTQGFSSYVQAAML